MEMKRFGVIGVGGWGETHVRAYLDHPLAEVAAISDVDADRLDDVAERHDIGNTFADYRDLLSRDDIDAVSIVTPDFAHTEIALAALDAGKHVLIEKPMATTVEDCRTIAAKVRDTGLTFMVDFHNRWNPAFAKAQKAISEGEIGKLMYVYYRLSDTIFVPTEMLSWAGRSTVNWFLASHCLDTLMWLFDDVVDTVYSVSRSEVLKNRGIDTPDFFTSILQFRKGGVATLENGWILPNSAPNIIDFRVEMLGSEGVLYTDGSHNRVLEKYTARDASYPDVLVCPTVHGRPMGLGVDSIRAFVDCVARGEPPMVGVEEGERVTRTILAIEESARAGAEVAVQHREP